MYYSYKRTVKPGLKLEDKKRLKWCLNYRAWTFEDWKNIIYINKTSIQLKSICRKRRVWKRPNKACHPYVITQR